MFKKNINKVSAKTNLNENINNKLKLMKFI